LFFAFVVFFDCLLPMSTDAAPPNSAVHNCDQRAPIIELAHAALTKPLQLEQRGATDAGFVVGTSSVVWPVAIRMARYLCNHPELVRGKTVLELGAGIGIVGAAAAALGARRTVITDCEEALPLLRRNKERLAEAGVTVEIAKLYWGDASDHACVLGLLEEGKGFDVIVGSDILIAGFDTDLLWASCEALGSRDAAETATVLVGYEFREEWETVGTYIGFAEAAGFSVKHMPLGAHLASSDAVADADVDDSDDDDGMLLYTICRGPAEVRVD